MAGTRDRSGPRHEAGSRHDGPLRYSPAAERNLLPILGVLEELLTPPGPVHRAGTVLEVASGSGQHSVAFAERFPELLWQPSEIDGGMRESIRARAAASAVPNLREPLALDAFGNWAALRAAGPARIGAVIAINLLHISSWPDAGRLLANAAGILEPAGLLYLYGPFRRDGAHTSDGNARFDAVLRARDPSRGIRDLEAVSEAALQAGFAPPRVIDMPANNLSLILRKSGA